MSLRSSLESELRKLFGRHVITLLHRLFWNRQERRLRSAPRITIFFFLWLLAPQLLDWLLIPPTLQMIAVALRIEGLWVEQVVHFVLYLVSVILITWIAARYLDHRPLVDFGLRLSKEWRLDLLAGLGVGALLMALIFIAQWLLGWISVTGLFQLRLAGIPFVVGLFGPLLLFTGIAVAEELMFRGYLLHNLAEGFNLKPVGARLAIGLAWFASSVLFGLLHVFNPNSSWASTTNLVLAGLMLGLPTVLTGSLALPIGLHLTWNLFQGNVFGFPVSGNDFTGVTVIAIRQHGPAAWTGGSFGPEAGLLGLCAIGLGCGLILWWVRWRYGAIRFWLPLAIYQGCRLSREQEQQRREQHVEQTLGRSLHGQD